MKRTARYWLLASFGAFAACAIAAWLLLPFKPRVTFTSPQMAFYSGTNGTSYPDVSVMLRNDDRFPVWYRGNEVCVGEFTIEGDPLKGERHVHSDRGQSWNRLAPGETVALPIPSYELFDIAKIHLELRNWLGRETVCTSQAFDFSSVPVDGVANIGVRPPAPIPQKK